MTTEGVSDMKRKRAAFEASMSILRQIGDNLTYMKKNLLPLYHPQIIEKVMDLKHVVDQLRADEANYFGSLELEEEQTMTLRSVSMSVLHNYHDLCDVHSRAQNQQEQQSQLLSSSVSRPSSPQVSPSLSTYLTPEQTLAPYGSSDAYHEETMSNASIEQIHPLSVVPTTTSTIANSSKLLDWDEVLYHTKHNNDYHDSSHSAYGLSQEF